MAEFSGPNNPEGFERFHDSNRTVGAESEFQHQLRMGCTLGSDNQFGGGTYVLGIRAPVCFKRTPERARQRFDCLL